ncbi:MAG TPA: serine hydrolase domain-containing protein [Chitinophagales bacterium]|nr:serine hydrolase domain-containing protein [Chitinophagales bacterium]
MNNVDRILQDQINSNATPGVQYYFFNRESVIHSFVGGFADVGNRLKTTADTTYHAFSCTKTFTALAILQLEEKGKLRIEDSVKKYLPDMPFSAGVTIQHLLTHSAGIANPIPLSWIHLKQEHEAFDRDKFFKPMLSNAHIKHEPNEKFAYSNLGYVLLGNVIEHVAGVSYEEYVTENILSKLGINPAQLGFLINDDAQHAKGYVKRYSFLNLMLTFLIDKSKYMGGAEGEWKPFKDYYVNGVSYGGLIGTPYAFVKYIQAILEPQCGLISDRYKEKMFTENFTNNNQPTGMCLSWYSGQLNGEKYFAHAGGGGGFYSEIRIYPKAGVGSVIMFNRTGMTDERFLNKLDCYFINK